LPVEKPTAVSTQVAIVETGVERCAEIVAIRMPKSLLD
jgi:hypothetical protein